MRLKVLAALFLAAAAVAYGTDTTITAEKVGRRAMVISCTEGRPEVIGHNGRQIVVSCETGE
jgi:hypothetical protein